MWICLLLLSAQFVAGVRWNKYRRKVGIAENAFNITNCPINCRCSQYANAATTLGVDCHGPTDIDPEQLSEQIDSLLSSNLTYGLTGFAIINTPLTQVPLSVCRLPTSLFQLQLGFSRLIRLPDCLSNLTNLIVFSASDNAIETLQDGIFDGLTELRFLFLSRNRISSIGLSVFATPSDLHSLLFVDLSNNSLTSLEPWVFDIGLMKHFHHSVQIDLSYNNISQFMNKMARRIRCQFELTSVSLAILAVNLEHNRIRHFVDILNGWQLDITEFHLLPNPNNIYSIPCASLLVSTDGNNIPCDCINYHFYREVTLKRQQYMWGTATCILEDPLTKTSTIMNGYDMEPSLFNCELTEHCPAGCICVHRPANYTLHVYCFNTNITVLPLELPELPDNHTKYKLDLSNNRLLHRLEHRNYFVNTSILDVSNSGVDDIQDWEEIAKIPNINLYGNKIATLPSSFTSVNINGKLNLANNPWDCSCDNKWMSKWLNLISDRLKEKVLCDSPTRLRGKNIIQISDQEFCVDPSTEAVKTALSSVAGVLVILVSTGVIVHRLRVKLYSRWKLHPFDRDECLGEDLDYDVFLCCSSEDDEPHGQRILELIESKGYRVCYHERDFLPGERVSDNIGHSIESSKRTVCLLSENFLRSAWCLYEFQVAFHHNIVEKHNKRLIVLMMLDNPNDLLADDASDTATLRQFLRQYTYIDYTADDWLDKLLYALPLHGLLQHNEDPDTDVPLLQQ